MENLTLFPLYQTTCFFIPLVAPCTPLLAFGDDYADIGMLQLCGTGVAMGNAIDEVKDKADVVIGSNDEDGIAVFIENEII